MGLLSLLYMNGRFLYGLEVDIPITWSLLGSKHIPWIYQGFIKLNDSTGEFW